MSISFNFVWVFDSFKVGLIKMIAILLMSAKLAALGLFKIKLTWNKVYDVIVFVHDATNKTLSRYSNYIVDVVI